MTHEPDTWLATDSAADPGAFSKAFWERHREDLANGRFWANEIKGLQGDPAARLRKALQNLPLPGAFRHAAIATRALIREHRKAGKDPARELRLLYWLAAIESFGVPYSQRCQCPGYNILESVPASVLRSLPFDYSTLGHEQLGLLNKTDRKWLSEAWGAPSAHTTLNALHQGVWRDFEERYAERRRQDREALFGRAGAAMFDDDAGPAREPERRTTLRTGQIVWAVIIGLVALAVIAPQL